MSDIDKDRTNEQDRNQGEDGYVTIPSVTPGEPAVGKTPSDATEGTNSGVSAFSGNPVPDGGERPSEPLTTPHTGNAEHDAEDADDTSTANVAEQAKGTHGDDGPVPPDGVARKPRHASETKGKGTHASSDGKRHDKDSKKRHGKGNKHKTHHKHDSLLLAFSIAGFVMGGVALAVACNTANVVSSVPAYVTTTETTSHTDAVPFENENVIDDDSDVSYERLMQEHGLSDDDSTTTSATGYVGVRIGDTDNGVTVISVDADSPAAKAGIKKGDVIKSFGGITVTSAHQFVKLVRATNSGTKVKVSVQHSGGSTDSVIVTVGSMPTSNDSSSSSSSSSDDNGNDNQSESTSENHTSHDSTSVLDGSAIVTN